MFDQIYSFVLEQIGKNDLVAGGAVLAILAYILSYVKTVPFTLLYWGRLYFVTEIDIPDRSESFRWVSLWLAKHKYCKKAKRITVEAKHAEKESTERNEAVITPAPGSHLLFWRGRPMILTRLRKEVQGESTLKLYREAWQIKLFGGRAGIEEFIEECRLTSEGEKENFIQVIEAERGYWEKSSTRRKRSLDSVLLSDDLQERLTKDVKKFIESEDWYHSMNIPWRRGYLLHGPPGNGKSSLITAVASDIGFPIYVINLRMNNENDIVTLMSSLGRRSILLLEDIDCAFNKRKNSDQTRISLSTLLNMLDGVNASEGRLVFMTTNHPERLDPALIRPGRVDLQLELKNASARQASALYKRFFPQAKCHNEFGDKVQALNISMAKLQGYLLEHRDSMRDARANIHQLAEKGENAKVQDYSI